MLKGVLVCAILSWLDGNERELAAAQFIVNGVPHEVPVSDIEEFTVDVTSLGFGENSVQAVILDEQGMKVASPAVTLLVTEGRRQIPQALAAGGGFVATIARSLAAILILGILGVGGFFLWRQGQVDTLKYSKLSSTFTTSS